MFPPLDLLSPLFLLHKQTKLYSRFSDNCESWLLAEIWLPPASTNLAPHGARCWQASAGGESVHSLVCVYLGCGHYTPSLHLTAVCDVMVSIIQPFGFSDQ